LLVSYDKPFPTVLEIPSKEDKYNPEKDFILQKLKVFSGGQ
jgi:V-type H+-transporting ATPase subunit F